MAGKRKANIASTEDSSENQSERAPKVSRTALSPEGTGSGQRFGESADFIPLNQLSQVVDADEEDDEALSLIQGSQETNESSLTNSILYGMHGSYII